MAACAVRQLVRWKPAVIRPIITQAQMTGRVIACHPLPGPCPQWGGQGGGPVGLHSCPEGIGHGAGAGQGRDDLVTIETPSPQCTRSVVRRFYCLYC